MGKKLWNQEHTFEKVPKNSNSKMFSSNKKNIPTHTIYTSVALGYSKTDPGTVALCYYT